MYSVHFIRKIETSYNVILILHLNFCFQIIESLQPFAFLTVDGFNNQRKACRGTGIPTVNLRVWHEGDLKPQQLSALPDVIAENNQKFYSLTENEKDDPEFEKYLQEKEFAEQEALGAEQYGLDEIPKPLSKENYLHVFDNEPVDLWIDQNGLEDLVNGESKNIPGISPSYKGGRSNFQKKSTTHHRPVFEDLFHSAREKAFEDQELFY